MTSPVKMRIGAVNYLNSKPLIYQLAAIAPQAEMALDLPSRLADGLAEGRYDVALIPSIELFQDPSYTIVSDACIACRGPVMSVKLFSRTPIEQIRSLALDEGSRTSVALVRILLEQRYGLRPMLESLPIGATLADSTADAVLLIGDRAMHSPPGQFADVWDLGDEWLRWSELPFVFAMWVARAGANADQIAPVLAEARDIGVENLQNIADEQAAGLGLTRPACLAYLRDHLHFHLGPRERRGLEVFYNHAAELGMAPRGLDLGCERNETAG